MPYARIVNNIVESLASGSGGGHDTLVPDGTRVGDAYINGDVFDNPAKGFHEQDDRWDYNHIHLHDIERDGNGDPVMVNGEPVWVVTDAVEFSDLLKQVVAYHRWYTSKELTATIVADTYVKDGASFVVDEEDAELELKIDSGTEVSLFTKAHVTPNADSPNEYERYKFVNKNVYVSRDTFAKGIVAIDKVRQPYFDAEGAILDAHEVTPFTRMYDVIDAFNGYIS